MRLQILIVILLSFVLPSLAFAADEPPIRFAAPENLAMPLVEFTDGRPSRGILLDLGSAIAQRLGRRAEFVSVSAKRVPQFLTEGEMDGVCYVMPGWLEGAFDWSNPVIPDSAVIVAHQGAPRVTGLKDLAHEPLGTVIGHRYEVIETALGPAFVREDARTVELILRKISAGRLQYGVVNQLAYAFRAKNSPEPALRLDLTFESFATSCAFSRQSRVPFAAVSAAIDGLVRDGAVAEILARYR